MPSCRYPTSAPTRSGICAHKRSAARAKGISAACRLVLRTQPRLREDCPPLGSTVYKVELEVTAYRNASKAQVEVIRLSQ